MAFWYLTVTITLARGLEAPGRRLAVSLSGDESNQKQWTSVYMEGSANTTWSGSTFVFILGKLDTRVEFKIEESTLLSNNEVVGEVDVPLMDLLALVWDLYENGCFGDMEPKVLSLEVRSSSPETNGRTMGVLELSYKFGQQLSVEAPPESSAPRMRRPAMAHEQNAAPPPATNTNETVTASQQTAPPNHQAALSRSLSNSVVAFWYLTVTITSARGLEATGRRLAASLSGDESNQKQYTSVYMEGSVNTTWSGSTFVFILGEPDTRVEFKIEESTLLSNNEVVGEVDMRLMYLIENGCFDDMEPKVLSLEVRSSSPETNGRIMGVLELSYKFGQQFSVEAPPESSAPRMRRPPVAHEQNAAPPPVSNTSETVTASQQTAPPNHQAALPPPRNTGVAVRYPVSVYPPSTSRPLPAFPPNGTAYPPIPEPYHQTAPAGYRPAAQPPPRHPGRNFAERVGIGVFAEWLSSQINDPGSDGGDFTFPDFDT